MRERVLTVLKTSTGQHVSGEELSRMLGVSRTAVWKHIQALRDSGYAIESHPRFGYRLTATPDLLLPGELAGLIRGELLGRELHYYTRLSSTNDEAKRLAGAGCPEGTAVIAEEQTGGRGRLARGWFSPFARGIWMSVVLRPPFTPADAPKCTLMAAVAVNRALRLTTGIHCGIKWPNDILYQGRKLVGILTEMSAEMDAINHVVIGIGVNVNLASADFPPELASLATSVMAAAGVPCDRRVLAARILGELETEYRETTSSGFSGLLERWRKESVTLGQTVDVIGMSRCFSGKAVDIDGDGALLVETGDGLKRVLAGDVSIRAKE